MAHPSCPQHLEIQAATLRFLSPSPSIQHRRITDPSLILWANLISRHPPQLGFQDPQVSWDPAIEDCLTQDYSTDPQGLACSARCRTRAEF